MYCLNFRDLQVCLKNNNNINQRNMLRYILYIYNIRKQLDKFILSDLYNIITNYIYQVKPTDINILSQTLILYSRLKMIYIDLYCCCGHSKIFGHSQKCIRKCGLNHTKHYTIK